MLYILTLILCKLPTPTLEEQKRVSDLVHKIMSEKPKSTFVPMFQDNYFHLKGKNELKEKTNKSELVSSKNDEGLGKNFLSAKASNLDAEDYDAAYKEFLGENGNDYLKDAEEEATE